MEEKRHPVTLKAEREMFVVVFNFSEINFGGTGVSKARLLCVKKVIKRQANTVNNLANIASYVTILMGI